MRPHLSLQRAGQLAREHFALDGEVRELPSSSDRNYAIGEAAVLKVVSLNHHSEGTQRFENQVMLRIGEEHEVRAKRLLPPVPCPLPTVNGKHLVVIEDDDDLRCGLRAVPLLPGRSLREVAHGPALLHNLGSALGALDAFLVDEFSGEASQPATAPCEWDLLQATNGINRDLGFTADAQRCRLVEDLTARFVRDHEADLDGLRRSWIHGDANDDNVLVMPQRGTESSASGHCVAELNDPSRLREESMRPSCISGLIDFGDLSRSATVCEPAIALTYLLLDGPRHRRATPLRIIETFLRAYQAQFPLREEELTILFPLVLHRLCFSVVRSARAAAQDPSNEYLQISAEPAWNALVRLAAVHPRRVEWTARWACGYEPVRNAKRLLSWFGQRKTEPVLGTGLVRSNTTLVDFSLTNPHFAEVADPSHEPSVTRWTSELMGVDLSVAADVAGSDHLRQIGWGRWGEPRLVYAGEQFAGDPFAPPASQEHGEGDLTSNVDQQRTLHLGVDLFAPAGTSVFSPLDATVASIAENNDPFDYGGTVILEHEVALEFDDAAGAPDQDDSLAPSMRFFTLYGHLDPSSLGHLSTGDALASGDLIGRLGDPSCNGGWTPHLHVQLVTDLLDQPGQPKPQNFPGVAPAGERDLWMQVCPDPSAMLLRTRSGESGKDTAAAQSAPSFEPAVVERAPVAARRDRHLSPNLSLSYRSPLLMVRGRGANLYDHLGRRFVDLVNNVCHVGHAHPRVVAALRQQATLLNTNTRYLHPLIGDYAERLLMRLPERLEVCFFVNSGSEANDLALRLARNVTERQLVFCLEGAYHGHTSALIDVSPYKHDATGGKGTPPDVAKLPLPDPYRGTFRADGPGGGSVESGNAYARQAQDLVDDSCAQRAAQPAALIVESILGCGGQVLLPEGYLQQLFASVRQRGGVCIADEVQVGFGRVGSHFWGFELSGVEPDIVTLGKPIGNGHPLAAVITTREIAASFDNGMEYFNTFGGNPVSCAVGHAVLDVIEEENLQRHAWDLGRHLLSQLSSLQTEHPCLGEVRGSGLFLGIELVCCDQHRTPDATLASYLVERMNERGFLLSTDGPEHNVIKIKPPLVLRRRQADAFIRHLTVVLGEAQLRGGRCRDVAAGRRATVSR